MGRGPGRVQRALIDVFAKFPDRRFTIEELAENVYPGANLSDVHTDTVRRALAKLEPSLELHRCRIGKCNKRGWRYIIGRA